jgi:hypothetical protein
LELDMNKLTDDQASAERNAFETHARSINEPLNLTRTPGCEGVYLNDRTEACWAFWEARAAQAPEDWHDAYWNLRRYVESIGVDIKCYAGASAPRP